MYIKGVLISTYWNVNDVERFRKKSNHFVLISTYWNVNAFVPTKQPSQELVLISTYWNVNYQNTGYEGEKDSFNLNLLECKYN